MLTGHAPLTSDSPATHALRRPRTAGRSYKIVVTGAASGIGRATALLVAAEGGVPVLVARSADTLDAAKAEIEGTGGAAGRADAHWS